jgi:hypothetical protein
MLQASVGRVAWHSSIVICEAGAAPIAFRIAPAAYAVVSAVILWKATTGS